ncbi:MAG: cytochrome c3 family protein [Thermodesulfobacteriota bacterium]|nr:cytochrome c3 family protein [Thermodesulfobacteriota bacterium]
MVVLFGTTVLAEYHHVDDCSVCHYAGGAESSACRVCPNNVMIKCEINTPNSGLRTAVLGPYVCAEAPYNGICEVCHTSPDVRYYLNDGSGDPHPEYTVGEITGGPPGTDCTACHRHAGQFGHDGGFSCDSCHGQEGGAGTAFSHATHTAGSVPRGPGTAMACNDCHDTNSFPDFADGAVSLAATTACDGCHSPGGAFNGTGDLDGQNPDTVAFGAKYNWGDGIYESDGTTLKFDKEKWCVSCHDGGTSEIDGVAAPNVDLYYTSGHGRPDTNMDCLLCHDASAVHVDGEPRTYAFSDEDVNLNEIADMYEFDNSGVAYAAGYRLRYVDDEVPLMIPAQMHTTFSGLDEETIKSISYRRCFDSGCHDASTLFYQSPGYPPAEVTTNLATKAPSPPAGYSMGGYGNQHYVHIFGGYAAGWDSDWDTWTGFTGWGGDICVPSSASDSVTTCSTCHNVHGTAGSHGSTNEAMIRDGRLEGVMPTSDCGYTPRIGFGFTYLIEDTASGGYPWVTSDGATQSTSVGAVFRNNPGGVNYNCFCHGEGSGYYAYPPPGTNYDASANPPGYTDYLQYYRPWEDFVDPYIISGSVDTLDGVTMSGLPGDPVTKGGGLYSATVTGGWSGTVTPTLVGYTFSPTSRTYTDLAADQLNQDYTSSPTATYVISGSSGMDGVTMNGLPGSPETSGGGFYSAAVNAGWSGTVTPTLVGYNFSPPSRVYTDVFSDQSGQDYTPALNSYTISGTVGVLDGVTMNGLPGDPETLGGFYSVTVDHGWSGTVTPTKEGYTFNPASRVYVSLSSDQLNENYTPIIDTYTISGSVGTLDGVTMNGLPGNPQTSGGGLYSGTVDHGWSGTVTPTLVGYTFSPENLVYTNVTSDCLGQDYAPTTTSYTISGAVGSLDGVTMSGLPSDPETSGGGLYSAIVGHGWSGTVTPTLDGYLFAPPSRVYSSVNGDQVNQDYTPSLDYGIIHESFEGPGYEEAFTENVGTSCILDEDSSIPGTPPVDFGSQCLKSVSNATGYKARADLVYDVEEPKTFTSFYALIASENLAADGSYKNIAGLYDANTNKGFVLRLYKGTAGNLKFKYRLYNNGSTTTVYTSSALSLNTWYKIGVKYDDVSNTYEFRLDDAPVSSGSLSGLHATGIKQWRLGFFIDSNPETGTVYFDELAVDTESFN